jgi:hypothetical protein
MFNSLIMYRYHLVFGQLEILKEWRKNERRKQRKRDKKKNFWRNKLVESG